MLPYVYLIMKLNFALVCTVFFEIKVTNFVVLLSVKSRAMCNETPCSLLLYIMGLGGPVLAAGQDL